MQVNTKHVLGMQQIMLYITTTCMLQQPLELQQEFGLVLNNTISHGQFIKRPKWHM